MLEFLRKSCIRSITIFLTRKKRVLYTCYCARMTITFFVSPPVLWLRSKNYYFFAEIENVTRTYNTVVNCLIQLKKLFNFLLFFEILLWERWEKLCITKIWNLLRLLDKSFAPRWIYERPRSQCKIQYLIQFNSSMNQLLIW